MKKALEPVVDFIPRKQIHRLTNGLISSKTLANLDSLGLGPSGRVRVGRLICYPRSELLKWLEERTQVIE